MDVFAPSIPTPLSPRRNESRYEEDIRKEERRRIGRELHDSTSQLLVALQLNLACLKRSSAPHDTEPHFLALDDILQELHREVRSISCCSESSPLNESLPTALSGMASRFALLADIDVTVKVRGDYVSQAEDAEISLYRIAQEALANIARHARATKVNLELDCSEGRGLTLTVEDDGIGFGSSKDAHRPEAGKGLGNIRQRVRDMGGQLTFKQLCPGSSMSVTVCSSLSSATADA